MKFKNIKNQRGAGFFEVLFWVLVIAVLAWAAKQYLLHPEGLNPRGVTQSPYGDTK